MCSRTQPIMSASECTDHLSSLCCSPACVRLFIPTPLRLTPGPCIRTMRLAVVLTFTTRLCEFMPRLQLRRHGSSQLHCGGKRVLRGEKRGFTLSSTFNHLFMSYILNETEYCLPFFVSICNVPVLPTVACPVALLLGRAKSRSCMTTPRSAWLNVSHPLSAEFASAISLQLQKIGSDMRHTLHIPFTSFCLTLVETKLDFLLGERDHECSAFRYCVERVLLEALCEHTSSYSHIVSLLA